MDTSMNTLNIENMSERERDTLNRENVGDREIRGRERERQRNDTELLYTNLLLI